MTDPMVPEELHTMFYTTIETAQFHDSIEMVEAEMAPKDPVKKEEPTVNL